MEDIFVFLQNNTVLVSLFSAAISFIALIRPELAKGFKKLFNRIAFYPSASIEIGFSDLGPTIGLQGTYRAVHSEQFISEIKVHLVRDDDNATKNYRWAVFREIDLVDESRSKLQVAHAFNILPATPERKDIQFHDIKTKEKFYQELLNIESDFKSFFQKSGFGIEKVQEAKDIFRKDKNALMLAAYKKIGDEFYWREGFYKIFLTIVTDNPTKRFVKSIKFSLTAADVAFLEQNKVWLLEKAMHSEIRPNFVYVSYSSDP